VAEPVEIPDVDLVLEAGTFGGARSEAQRIPLRKIIEWARRHEAADIYVRALPFQQYVRIAIERAEAPRG
jgi:hypothetical protein